MRRQLLPAVIMMVVLTLVLGIGYALLVTGIAQLGFADKSNGSLIKVNGKAVGSKLLGQTFTKAKYFHGRPSAAGAAATGSDATDPNNAKKTVPNDPKDLSQDISSGSNLGPTNPVFLDAVKQRVKDYRKENSLASDVKVPVDAVTVANARLQAPRVAKVRGLPLKQVLAQIDANTDDASLGFLGDKGVNVLELNVALDRLT
jgi:K+-transporting ATPase ATPase C chain